MIPRQHQQNQPPHQQQQRPLQQRPHGTGSVTLTVTLTTTMIGATFTKRSTEMISIGS